MINVELISEAKTIRESPIRNFQSEVTGSYYTCTNIEFDSGRQRILLVQLDLLGQALRHWNGKFGTKR